MNTVFLAKKYMLILSLVALSCLVAASSSAQTYNFRQRDESIIKTAQQIKDHNGFADTIIVRQGNWNEMASNPSWSNNLKFKSVHGFVKFYVNHAYPTRIHDPYTFRLVYKVYGYPDMTDTVGVFEPFRDTLTISYKADSLASYQDIQYKKYSNYHKMVIVLEGLYKINGANDPPVLMDLSTSSSFNQLNFNVEGSILVQPYHKRVATSSGYIGVYGPNAAPLTIGNYSATNDYLPVKWNLQGMPLAGNPELSPVNYELEWTYIDNYKVNSIGGTSSTIPASSLSYSFKNNATRVWLDTSYYQIPLIYQKGHLVYRVRMVRPDSSVYRYPIYGPWTLGENGTVSSAPAHSKYEISAAHLNDSLNWQYTVSFAEQGKYKHVMSYYDGMLKNRQSITRFNSAPEKLIATEQVYDYEGRPSLSILPTPISSPNFRYQYNLSLNGYSGLPYKAGDFDFLSLGVCPMDSVIAPLGAASPANIYYSSLNPDKNGFQKFVPDAGGYPLVQTIYSPGYDERVEKQGGAGDSLQIGFKHNVKNDYVSADQIDLNRLFGTNIGWSGFYRKTVSRDPNGQLSLNVSDYKGKTITSSMIGIPDLGIHAIVANDNVADTAFYLEDHILGNTQQVMGNKRILDKNFFNDAGANNISFYNTRTQPYATFCPGSYLTVAARYDYSVFDECGTLIVDTGGNLGNSGVVNSPAIISSNSDTVQFFMEKGKHSLNKVLTVNTDEVNKAVDAFLAMDPTKNCMKTEPWFIKESVLSKQFPCPDNNWSCGLDCGSKKYQMMEELWPNKDSVYSKRKYGIYRRNTGTVLGSNNSIFTLRCTGESYPSGVIVTEDAIRSVLGGTYNGGEGGNFVIGNNNFGVGPDFNGFILNGPDTLRCSYRYQDECITGLPSQVTRFGQTYSNLQSLPVDTFIYIFNDTIAEALLPLHPEYCNLLDCVDDPYAKKVKTIPDAGVAEGLGLFYLNQLITADPVYAAMQALPASYPNPYDSLAYSGNGVMSLDTLAMLHAYCNSNDSIMMAECYINMFNAEISGGVLNNNFVKKRYFDFIKQVYLGNRKRFVFNLSPLAAGGASCSTCQPIRMDLVPFPVFITTTNPVGGGLATGPGSFLGTANTISPGSATAISTLNEYFSIIDTVDLDTMYSYSDSAVTQYNTMTSILCNGAIDQIIQQLVNCTDSLTLLHVRDSLQHLCTVGAVAVAGFTPAQIRHAITANGIAIGDLCNPYLINYDQNMSMPVAPAAFSCNNISFYTDASSTFAGAPMSALLQLGTPFNLNLNAANQFELSVSNELGSATSCVVTAAYDAPLKLYTLNFFSGGNSVQFFLKSGNQGTCANAFTPVNGNDVMSIKIDCVNNNFSGLANGYVGKYAFGATVTHNVQGVVTNCWLPGWNDKVQMNNEGTNPIGVCVPCTQMKDLYVEFRDTMAAYNLKGTDHPYYGIMLRNFMNFKLKKAFVQDQYTTFIESCGFSDLMRINRYVNYFNVQLPTSAAADDFLNGLDNVVPGLNVNPVFRMRQPGTTYHEIGISLLGLPVNKLRYYRDYISSFPTTVLSNYPLNTYHGEGYMGTLFVRENSSFVPGSFVFNNVAGSLTFTANGNFELWNGTAYELHRLYTVFSPVPSNYANNARRVAELTSYIYDAGINARYHQGIDPAIHNQHFLTEKQNYLTYTYDKSGMPANLVLDTLQTPIIEQQIPGYGGQHLSYGHPAAPGNIQNLYIADPGSATNGTNFDKLVFIMNQAVSYFNTTLGKPAILFSGSDTRNILSNNQLNAYRCGDTAYWFRHFGQGDTLYNAFIRVPAYLDTAQLAGYELDEFGFNPGDGLSRSFYLRLSNPALPGLPLLLNGHTDFTVARNEVLNDVLLAHTVSDPVIAADTVNNCERTLLRSAVLEGKIRYQVYLDSIRQKLRNGLFDHVMNGGISEKLMIGYKNQRFNYTLYNYDRAGNLIATVPPAGVAMLNGTTLDAVDVARTSNGSIQPLHHKVSEYKYNTLNQVQQQKTPDGGITEYFYDAASRVIFSQNEKQRFVGAMTYTLYDKQGRIEETGEATISCTPYFVPFNSPDILVSQPCSYYDGINGQKTPFPEVVHKLKFISHDMVKDYIRSISRKEVVATHYDKPAITPGAGMPLQENLRKRVASIKYFDFVQPTDTAFVNYDYAMHFSYDISGNVQSLVRDYPAWAISNQQFKRVDYDYDVISGKVNMLSYNRSFADQYYQRYAYDADNRITQVETSSDGFIWHRDAAYQYYQHGPLARMSLGDLRVQGVDYAYTIQGWLKAINGDILDSLKDMGADGVGNSTHAHDAVALSLSYFNGDYKPIGATAAVQLPHNGKNMYNGNIPTASTSILPFPDLVSSYTYDQLNRLVRTDYQDLNRTNAQLTNTEYYYSRYAYDADGNLNKLVRNGNIPGKMLMDSLIYRYTNNAYNDNKLQNVNDYAANTYTNDIRNHENASISRYLYDATGNVIKDQVSNQDTIQWNHYNKVTRTRNDSLGNGLHFAYDGAGNRFLKSAVSTSGDTTIEKSDYYVRDAQGNILAIYNAESRSAMGRREWIEYVTSTLMVTYDRTRFFSDIISPHYAHIGSFKAAVIQHAGANGDFMANVINSKPVSFYSGNNTAIRHNILAHTGDYGDFYTSLATYNAETGIDLLGSSLYAAFLKNDISFPDFMTETVSQSEGHINSQIFEKFCEPKELVLAVAREMGEDIEAQMMENGDVDTCVAILAFMENKVAGDPYTFFDFYHQLASQPGYNSAYYSLVNRFVSDFDIIQYPPLTEAGGGILIPHFQTALGKANPSAFGAFLDTWAPAGDLLLSTNNQFSLMEVVYDHDNTAFLTQLSDQVFGGGLQPVYGGLYAIDWLTLPHYLRRWQEVTIITPVLHTVYENVLQSRRMNLSSHHIYGSSRLGTKDYLAGQYYSSWDYTGPTPIHDTANLLTRRPWFSLEYNDNISGLSPYPWSMTDFNQALLSHQVGQKQYELSNHLGNVQATVTDLPVPQGEYVYEYNSPALAAAYDYYPFGMLMPGRYVSDTTQQCVTVTQTKWVTTYIDSCYDVVTWGNLRQAVLIGNGHVTTYTGTIQIEAATVNDGFGFHMDALALSEQELSIDIDDISGTGIIQAMELVNGNWVSLGSASLSKGRVTLRVLPTTSDISVRVLGPVIMQVRRVCIKVPGLSQESMLVDICDGDGDRYRFGFNGQEKVNEWSGVGNHNTALYWEYDTRTGRRLNLDPESNIWESTYATFGSNPIRNADLLGNKWYDYAMGFAMATINDALPLSNPSMRGWYTPTDPDDYYTGLDQGDLNATAMGIAAIVVGEGAQGGGLVLAVTGVGAGPGAVTATAGMAMQAEGASMIIQSMRGKSWTEKQREMTANSQKPPTQPQVQTPKADEVAQQPGNQSQKANNKTRQDMAREIQQESEKAFGNGGVCFVGGTLVTTNLGLIPIEQINVGDSVWTFNPSTKETRLEIVEKHFTKHTEYLVRLDVGNVEIWVTPEHPFYVNSGEWKDAGDLSENDLLWIKGGQEKLRIIKKHSVDSSCTVYNMHLGNVHTYWVSVLKVVVHNAGTQGNTSTKSLREKSSVSRDKWEKATGQKWPKEPDNPSRNQSVSHKKALNDGGTNDVDNIEPKPWKEHHKMHKDNGDFKRWAEDKGKKKNN